MKRLIMLAAVLTALPFTALAADVESREVAGALTKNMVIVAMCQPTTLESKDITDYLEAAALLTENGGITAEEWIGMTGALLPLIQQTSQAERRFPDAVCGAVVDKVSITKLRALMQSVRNK